MLQCHNNEYHPHIDILVGRVHTLPKLNAGWEGAQIWWNVKGGGGYLTVAKPKVIHPHDDFLASSLRQIHFERVAQIDKFYDSGE